MFNKHQHIYRKESLERLSSPERLDQLMQVVAPQDWIGLVVFGGLIGLGVVWSFVGRIPVTVDGRGVLTNPNQVVELQAPVEGRIQGLNVKVGDRVRQGDVLGVIDQSDVREQLRLQQANLAELRRQERQLGSLSRERLTAERQAIQQQRQALQQRSRDAQELDPLRHSETLVTIRQQKRGLQQQLQDLQALSPVLKTRLENRKQLQNQGAIAADAVIQAEREYRENTSQIAGLQSQIQELHKQDVETERAYRESLNQIADLQVQIKTLDSREQVLRQQSLEAGNTRQNQIQAVNQAIAQLQKQLQIRGQIVSPATGRLFELGVVPGQMLKAGVRFGAIATINPSPPLVSLTYFPIKDGKRIQPGMAVQITPDHIQRAEFGGILGTITAVSTFPISRQAMATAVGSTEVAEGLALPGGQIEAVATLKPSTETVSGYRWSSSQGPDRKLSPGTTVAVRVILREQAPISFVLPILRSASGIH